MRAPAFWILLLLASAWRPAAAERVGERWVRRGLIKPLLKPGQSLQDGLSITSRTSRQVKGALEWSHFSGTSRLTGQPVVGVVQRWELPAGGLGPRDLLACLVEGGTEGRSGEGPRFVVKATLKQNRWCRAAGGASLFDPGSEGAIVRGENIRPPTLSSLYHPNAFNMYVDRDRISVSNDHAQFEGQLVNPSHQAGPLPGKQYGLLRISARRKPGGMIELSKEYVAVQPKQFIATAAPVMKPVSALLGLWSSVPRVLRDYTPAGVAMKVGAAVGSSLTDAVLGSQMQNLILDRHSDLLHTVAVPNLARAFQQRAAQARAVATAPN